MDASLPRPDTVTARAVAEKPDGASLHLPAHSKPRLQGRADSVSWEVCRDALVTVLVWLVLFGLVLFALSRATARVRPTVPVDRLASFVSSDVSGIDCAERYVTTLLRLMPLVEWTWRIR